MAYTSVKTIWQIQLEACRSLGISHVPLPFSTLNEYFGIQAGATIPAGQLPKMGYLAIGRGGHRNVSGSGGESLTDTLQHKVKDARLFVHLPFIMRPVENDLKADERAKYRLRRLENHGGNSYFAYYLMPTSLGVTQPEFNVLTTVDQVTTSVAYEATADQLSPVPVSIVNNEVNTATGTHISVGVPISIVLSSVMIAEIIAAAEIIYGDTRYAEITEVAVCSGFDKQVTSSEGGTTVTYTETIVAQCCTFLGADHNLRHTGEKIELKYKLRGTVPLLT